LKTSRVKVLQLLFVAGSCVIVVAAMIVGAHKIVVTNGSISLRAAIPTQPVSGIEKVNLGMSLDQVAKVYPDFDTVNTIVQIKNKNLNISFDVGGGVRYISSRCSDSTELKQVASIFCGETISELNYVYGDRLVRYCALGEPRAEFYQINDLSVAYWLWDKKVVDLIVKDPGWMPRGYKQCRRQLLSLPSSIS